MRKRTSVKKTFYISGILFLLIGILFTSIGFVTFVSNKNFKKTAETTKAVITHIESRYTSKGNNVHDVTIKYFVDDIKYEKNLNEYYSGWYEGKEIDIYYDPENPYDVRTGNYTLPVVFSSVGGMFAIIGGSFVFINVRSARKRKSLIENGDRMTGIITAVNINTSVRINNRHPYKAECEVIDPYNGERYLYSSGNITTDIAGFVGNEVTVYVDRNDKSKYYVDIDELLDRYIKENNIHDYR